MNIDRAMATVRTVSRISPIKDADSIELATVDGWQVVVKKGEFKEGDLAIYFEIDSWIPIGLAPFLRKSDRQKIFNGVDGERLRTVKLRGEISQGLLLPISAVANKRSTVAEGDDLTELLGIQKWEREIPVQLAGQVKGNFPEFIPKTDQPRIQNIWRYVQHNTDTFEVTEKMDGSSMTVYWKKTEEDGGVFGVCSRNLDLKPDENNTFWQTAFKYELYETLSSLRFEVALQGELIGPGIQKNPYGLSQHEFMIFDVYDIERQMYLSPQDRRTFCKALNLTHVPVVSENAQINALEVDTDGKMTPRNLIRYEQLLQGADGESVIAKRPREGLVYKTNSTVRSVYPNSFKVISNAWLLKEKD